MTDEVIVLGGGIRGGMPIADGMMLQEFINSMTTSYDVNYIIRGWLPPEPATCNEYFTQRNEKFLVVYLKRY